MISKRYSDISILMQRNKEKEWAGLKNDPPIFLYSVFEKICPIGVFFIKNLLFLR